MLRAWLTQDAAPISRHYLYSELEAAIYSTREVFGSALSEYDEVCEAHHAEMEAIRPALVAKFGAVPVIDL